VINYDGQGWDLLDSGPLLPHGESSGWATDIWGASSSDIFVVGQANWINDPGGLGIGQEAIFHYDGNTWTTQETIAGDCAFFNALWGSSGSDVFAGGSYDCGFIEHYDGVSWAPCRASDNAGLVLDTKILAIWGTGSSDVFAAGTSQLQEVVAIYHYDGSQWGCVHSDDASAQSFVTWRLNSIWSASSSDAFAVGSGHDADTGARRGIVLHYDGSTTSLMSVGTANELTAVWGSSASDVYAVGTNGTILHFDGCAWTPMDSGTASNLHAIWGSGPDVFAVGDNGTVLHYCSDPAVTFADRQLEIAIRHEIGEYSGVLRRSDVAGIATLTDIGGTPIRHLSGLEYCTSLTRLDLDDNEIGDISALSGLTGLTLLSLKDNHIADIKPLVDNPGIGTDFGGHQGDLVYLQGNPLSSVSVDSYLPALAARGAEVFWDGVPPEAPAGDPAAPEGDAPSSGTVPAEQGPSGTDQETTAAAVDGVTGTGATETAPVVVPETAAITSPSASGGPTAGARLWLLPVAVVGGFLALSAAASSGAWLRGRLLI
jgi:hypothetical protein